MWRLQQVEEEAQKMNAIGKSVKVVQETILESDPAKQGGEYAFVSPGKIFPPVDTILIDGENKYFIWENLFSDFGVYAMKIDDKTETIPPVPLELSYNSFQPWVLKLDIDVTPKERKPNWFFLLLAGLFLFSRK